MITAYTATAATTKTSFYLSRAKKRRISSKKKENKGFRLFGDTAAELREVGCRIERIQEKFEKGTAWQQQKHLPRSQLDGSVNLDINERSFGKGRSKKCKAIYNRAS